ncbi:hypothetical protein Pfo_016473, partial [Paulownia fortunei]
ETRDALPAHFLSKIESFSLLSEYGIQKYESRNLRLIIYPDGHKSENEGEHISVYLSMVGSSSLPVHCEVNAIFSIFLFNQILDNYLCFPVRRFHALKSIWGFSKLISKKSSTDESNGYLVDDNCVFGAEVFVIKSQRVIESASLLKFTYPYKRDWKNSEFSKLEDVWTFQEFTAGLSQWFTSSQCDWGLLSFIPIADMRDPSKGFIVDDCCVLEIEIFVQAVVRDAPLLE